MNIGLADDLKSVDTSMEEEEEKSAVPKLKDESQSSLTSGSNKRTRPSPVPFFSGNPMVEHTAGILHIYKDEYVYNE